MGVVRLGATLSSISASPPSVFSTFFSCANTAEAVAMPAPIRKARREVPSSFKIGRFPSGSWLTEAFLWSCGWSYLSASNLQLAMQLPQTTQRE